MNSGHEIAPAPISIVVIDDDPAVRHSLKFSLEIEGYSVHLFRCPEDVLNGDGLPQHGCMVIDHLLPQMLGLDLLAELRRRHVTLPAIIMTTQPSAALRERAARMGSVIVEKPLLGDTLTQAIRETMARVS